VPEDPATGEQLTGRIRRALEARLARYKLPKRLHLVGSLDALCRQDRQVANLLAYATLPHDRDDPNWTAPTQLPCFHRPPS
jgi:hypothetical protein